MQDASQFKSLTGALQYLTFTRLVVLCSSVGVLTHAQTSSGGPQSHLALPAGHSEAKLLHMPLLGTNTTGGPGRARHLISSWLVFC
jgi:hypothetical protein